MRSASVDNRSRAIWLLAGLGVLIWAVLSVFLGGSPAHADEPVVQPPKQMQQARAAHHAQPPAPPAPRAEAQQKRAQRQSAAPQKPAPGPAQQKPTAQKPLAAHTIVPPPTKPAAPRPTAALSQAASARMDAATQRRAAAMQAREEARSLPQRTAHIVALHRQDRDDHRAHRDHVGDPHQRSPQADAAARHDARQAARHQPAQATKRASDSTNGAHAQHSPRTSAATSVRTAPAPAAVTPAATSGAASEKEPAPSPFDTRGASSQHQPAAPPSASSAGVGPSASAGVLPGVLQASDVLGPLLAAVHAGDAVLPTGPAGSTDHSPD